MPNTSEEEKRIPIQELEGGGYRICTPEEVGEAEAKRYQVRKLQKQRDVIDLQLQELVGNCTHPVCYDEDAGMGYTCRVCVICRHQEIF